MDSIQAHTYYNNLLQAINRIYPVACDQIHLYRDMIGYVFFLKNSAKKYVLKLYRSFDSENALRSAGMIQYLKENDFPVVSIVPTYSGELHATIQTPQGPSVAILFDFVEGTTPELEIEITNIGRQVGRLHRLMQAYPAPLIRRGKDFYIDRYISILQELDYPPGRIAELDGYGSELWSRMELLPRGFCHGDLHTGNMIQDRPDRYVLFDFDVASRTYSVIDVATLSNASDFNRFEDSAYDKTLRVFDRFYQGYSREIAVTEPEIAAIFDFIPIRHYEIIATITDCQGLEGLSWAFLDEQYEWLLAWKNLCERKAR